MAQGERMTEERTLVFAEMAQAVRPYTITFYLNNGKDVAGTIEVADGEMRFTGNADESARIFFDACLKPICDRYLAREVSA